MPFLGKCIRKLRFLCLHAALLFSLSSYTLLPLSRLAEKGVQVSHLPGFYASAIPFTASRTGSARLVYTTNGNLPGKSSSSLDNELTLDRITPLTVGLITDNKLSDTFYCGTYVINFQSTLPITCLIIPPDDLFDSQKGIYLGGLTSDGDTYGNCWKDIEKQTFFEYFDHRQPIIAQGCGLKIFGGMTRQNKEKSMRVIAREKYGKGKFKYKFFSTKDREVFNSLVLRTSGNDYLGTRFLDMMISSLAKDLGVDYLAYQPSVLLVNGTYWGIHNLREKMNDDYLEETYGASPDSTDLLQGSGSAQVGSNKKYKELFRFLEETSPKSPGFIDSLETRMDIQNYFNYLILEIHIVNQDSRGNVRYWSSSALDEKFRWVYYDGDLSFGNPKMNYLDKRLSATQTDWFNPNWTTFLLRKLTQNDNLRDRFITQYCYLRSTVLSADTITSRIAQFRHWLEPEIDRHLVRKDFKQTRSAWESRIKNLVRFAQLRDSTSIRHLRESFSLGGMYTLQLSGSVPPTYFSLWFNGNKLATLPYSGVYFKGVGSTVEIRSVHPLYRFRRWSDGFTSPVRLLNNAVDSVLKLEAVFEKVPFSPLQRRVQFQVLATGRKDKLSFIYITDSAQHHPPLRWSINNLLADLPLSGTIEKDVHQVVVCNDVSTFKKRYPYYRGQIVHYPSLSLARDIRSLYLFDEKGDLLDSVNFRGIKGMLNANVPFYLRDSGHLVGSLALPQLNAPVLSGADNNNIEVMITFWAGLSVSLVLIFGLPLVLVRRKRAPVVVLFGCMLMGASAFCQENIAMMPKRKVDPAVLLSAGKIHKQLPVQKDCFYFFCSYAPVRSRLIWVAPFREQDVFSGMPLQEKNLQYYKDLKSDGQLHARMSVNSDTVRNYVNGSRTETHPLGSSGKWMLVKVLHANGMESWYYPVQTQKNMPLTSDKGTVLGKSSGQFFWEIRYRQRSFAITGLVDKSGKPDTKGYFLENMREDGNTPEMRYQAFVRSLEKNNRLK